MGGTVVMLVIFGPGRMNSGSSPAEKVIMVVYHWSFGLFGGTLSSTQTFIYVILLNGWLRILKGYGAMSGDSPVYMKFDI